MPILNDDNDCKRAGFSSLGRCQIEIPSDTTGIDENYMLDARITQAQSRQDVYLLRAWVLRFKQQTMDLAGSKKDKWFKVSFYACSPPFVL